MNDNLFRASVTAKARNISLALEDEGELTAAHTVVRWRPMSLSRVTGLPFLSQMRLSNCLCLRLLTDLSNMRSGKPRIPHVAKRTRCLIFWELTIDSSEYVFIANYISRLCSLLLFRLWLGLAYQFIAMHAFLFLQHLQEYTAMWAARHLYILQTWDGPRKAKSS